MNKIVIFVENSNKKKKISSSDELCQTLRDAAAKLKLILRDEHIFTLLGKDVFMISFDELVKRLYNVLLMEGHNGFISMAEEEKQDENDQDENDDKEETKTPIQQSHKVRGRKSERAAASKAKKKLKDDWKVIGTPDGTTPKTSQKKRRKRVEPQVLEHRKKIMLKFCISLDSSRQRFLYPAEMYFEEIHREQANEASTQRQRAEEVRTDREMGKMRQAELETRMSNLYEQAQERFRKGWSSTQGSESLPPLIVHSSLQDLVSLNRTVFARRLNQRSSKAQKLNEFERKRLQEMRNAQKITKQVAKVLKSMVIRVEREMNRDLKREKKREKKLQKELLRKKRVSMASKQRKIKIRKNTFLRCLREEVIFRKRCIQHIRAARMDETKCTWPPRDSEGNLIPLPNFTKDDQDKMTLIWSEDSVDPKTERERLDMWNRYIWNKLAEQKLPERSKISSVLMIQSLLYRAERLGIDVVTNPRCVMLQSQLSDRKDKLLNGFKKYKKMYRVRLKLGGEIVRTIIRARTIPLQSFWQWKFTQKIIINQVRHELDGKIPEYSKPGEIVALERSRRNIAEESLSASKASKRRKMSSKKSYECSCKCTNMNQTFVQCDRGNGWWCLNHSKLTAIQAETVETWVCPNCSKASSRKSKAKKKRVRPTNATLGISELFETTKKAKLEAEVSYSVLSQEALARCPRCKGNALTQGDESKTWLCCDRCDRWIHAECESCTTLSDGNEMWFCDDCVVPCEDTAFYFDRERRGKRVKVYLKLDGSRILKEKK